MPVEATITSINTSSNVITATGHGFATGDVIGWYPGALATLPTTTPATSLNVPYIVRRIDANTLTLHPTLSDANANTNPIAFTDDGDGTLELVQLSVRERIERELLTTIDAVNGIGDVQRFSQNGNRLAPNTDGTWPVLSIVLCEDEAVMDSPSGFYTRMLTVTIETHIIVDTEQGIATPAVANRLNAKIEAAVNADPHVTETATGRALAVDLKTTGIADFEVQDGQPEIVSLIELEIQYRHLRDNPASVG